MIYGANITINWQICYANTSFLPTQKTFAELYPACNKPFKVQISVHNFSLFNNREWVLVSLYDFLASHNRAAGTLLCNSFSHEQNCWYF